MKALAALLLAVVTVLFHQWDARFVPTRPGILANLDFADGAAGWRIGGAGVRLPDGEDEALVLETGAGRRLAVVGRYLREPTRFGHIRVAVTLAAEGVVAGDQDWQRAGVILRAYGADGRALWYWPYVVALIDGSRDWRRYQAVIPTGDAAAMHLFVYNAGREGRLFARALAVDAVAETGWARAARLALATLWAALALWVALPLAAASWRSGSRLATLALAAVIAVGVLTPQPLLSDSLEGIEAAFDALLPPPAPEMSAPEVPRDQAGSDPGSIPAARGDAAGERPPPAGASADVGEATTPLLGVEERAHLAAFALLALLAGIAFRRAGALAVLAYLLAAAVAFEAVQAFLITRTADFADGAMNAIGVVVGSGLAFGLRAVARRIGAARRRPDPA